MIDVAQYLVDEAVRRARNCHTDTCQRPEGPSKTASSSGTRNLLVVGTLLLRLGG